MWFCCSNFQALDQYEILNRLHYNVKKTDSFFPHFFWMQHSVTFLLITWMRGSRGTLNFRRVAASCSNTWAVLLIINDFCRQTTNPSTVVVHAWGLTCTICQNRKRGETDRRLGLGFIVFTQCRKSLGFSSPRRVGTFSHCQCVTCLLFILAPTSVPTSAF